MKASLLFSRDQSERTTGQSTGDVKDRRTRRLRDSVCNNRRRLIVLLSTCPEWSHHAGPENMRQRVIIHVHIHSAEAHP